VTRPTSKNSPVAERGVTLYLVRHAIAEERGSDWPDDTKRPLTHRGMARMREAVRGLDFLGVEIGLVLTSPLVRARQTAEILARGLASVPAVDTTNALIPGQPPARMVEALAGHSRQRAIALVGHEPGLGELAAWLIGAREPLPFKKGGICCIELPSLPAAPTGQLIWFALPKMLRSVSRKNKNKKK
jgi:phosphohistidine phosphatase